MAACNSQNLRFGKPSSCQILCECTYGLRSRCIQLEEIFRRFKSEALQTGVSFINFCYPQPSEFVAPQWRFATGASNGSAEIFRMGRT
jgi:hypothetical protein